MNDKEKIDFITKAFSELFNKQLMKPIESGDKLADFGLDSLDIVELQLYYEETFKKEIPDNGKAIATISDLLELM